MYKKLGEKFTDCDLMRVQHTKKNKNVDYKKTYVQYFLEIQSTTVRRKIITTPYIQFMKISVRPHITENQKDILFAEA